MSKEITDTKVQVESSLAASKRSVDESTRESKSTVVLDDNPGNETHDDATISSVRVVLLGILLLVIGAMGFYYLPGMVATNAKGSKLVNSIYCSVITLTTYVLYASGDNLQIQTIISTCNPISYLNLLLVL